MTPKHSIRQFLKLADRKRLTKRQEQQLWRAYKAGNTQALETLIIGYTRLVIYLARGRFYTLRKAGLCVPMEDLLSAGLLALKTTIDRWDPEKGKFVTYYVWYAKQAFVAACTDHLPCYIPTPVVQQLVRLGCQKADDEVDTVTVEAACGALNVTPRAAKRILPFCHISRVPEDLADETDTRERLIRKDDDALLQLALGSLSDKEQLVLKHRYGLVGKEETLCEVGKRLHCSREYVRQVENHALKRLRIILPSLMKEQPPRLKPQGFRTKATLRSNPPRTIRSNPPQTIRRRTRACNPPPGVATPKQDKVVNQPTTQDTLTFNEWDL